MTVTVSGTPTSKTETFTVSNTSRTASATVKL